MVKVVLINHHVAVADQYEGMAGFSVGGDEVVHFGIEADAAFLHDDGYVTTGVLVLDLFCDLVSRVVAVLKAKENFVVRVVLVAEAREIVEQVVVEPSQGFRIDTGGRGLMSWLPHLGFRFFLIRNTPPPGVGRA
jgi:hypothetical protein